jgi:general secretion pathway protein I
MSIPRQQHGFTLLEVIVAILVLGLGMMAAIKTVSVVSVKANNLQNKTYAQWVALNKVAEMRLQRSWPGTGKSEGESDMADRSWHWVMEVENTPDKDVRRLKVSVTPESEKNDKAATAEVTAFLGRPL